MNTLKIKIKVPEGEKMNWSNAGLFHGFLMEKIDTEYADKLHENGLKPYRQSVIGSKDEAIWTISTLNDEATDKIITPLLQNDLKTIEIKKKESTYNIVEKELIQLPIDSLISKYYFSDCPHIVKIKFLTPTAFKSYNKYVFYPDISLIYKSLMRKFDAFSDQLKVENDEILEQLISRSEIIGYNLKSTAFSLEGIKIPSFFGSVTLKIHGPQPLVNLATVLLRFGEFSGVGIKSAIGMGMIELDVK